MPTFAVSLCVWIALGAGGAGQTGMLHGRVTDATSAVTGVAVLLQLEHGDQREAFTDSAGDYV